MKRIDFGAAAIILCLVLIIGLSAGLGYLVRDNQLAVDKSDYGVISEMAETIKRHFFYMDDYAANSADEKLIDSALRGMVGSLGDPYAAYYTETEYNELLAGDAGDYKGLGISVLTPDETGSTIAAVYPNSPAEKAGLLAGDVIVRINGHDAAGLSLAAFTALFSEDDAVPDEVVVLRGNERLTITVYREDVHVVRVFSRLFEDVGYIRITEFNGSVVSDFWNAAVGLRDQGVTKLVIDLRGNPGGNLNEVLNVAYRLIPKDFVIATIRSRSGTETVYRSQGDERLEMELCVLVNGDSASASELLAGALQAHDIATIVGTQTFGKGIVQTFYRLRGNGGWIKLTTDAYYTPADVCIQNVGITPDIVTELPEELQGQALELLNPAEDTQLQAALHTLRTAQICLPAA